MYHDKDIIIINLVLDHCRKIAEIIYAIICAMQKNSMHRIIKKIKLKKKPLRQ